MKQTSLVYNKWIWTWL